MSTVQSCLAISHWLQEITMTLYTRSSTMNHWIKAKGNCNTTEYCYSGELQATNDPFGYDVDARTASSKCLFYFSPIAWMPLQVTRFSKGMLYIWKSRVVERIRT